MKESLPRLTLLAHLTATVFMTGLIWFVQVVHYPLFAGAGAATFAEYERRHVALTGWVVGPPMFVEGAAAVLLFWLRPAAVSAWKVWLGLGLLLVLWASTVLVQIPCHERLIEGFDPDVHQRLVWTNWIRTAAWSLRAALALWMVWDALA